MSLKVVGTPMVYIAGPMRGYPLYNFPAFDKAAEEMRSRGFLVVNPAQMDRDVGFCPDRDEATLAFVRSRLREDIQQILRCSHLLLLRGWEKSKGATLEHDIAVSLGLNIIYQDDELD